MDIKILIADDDESLRRVLQFKLKQNGYDVNVAEDGQKAYELLKTKRFDILLCDMKMPGLTGIELLEKSGLAEIEIKEGDDAIRISRSSSVVAGVPATSNPTVLVLKKPHQFWHDTLIANFAQCGCHSLANPS